MKHKELKLISTVFLSCLITPVIATEASRVQQSSFTSFYYQASGEKLYSESKVIEAKPLMSFGNLSSTSKVSAEIEVQDEEKPSFLEGYKKVTHNVLNQGMEYIGIRYRFGGSSESTGFDCSGFVKTVYKNSIGFILPRTSVEMSKIGEKISNLSSLKPGDLIFFNTRKKNFSHVGIYVGDNKFIHSPRKGTSVRVEKINEKYWLPRFNGGRRVVTEESRDGIFSTSIKPIK